MAVAAALTIGCGSGSESGSSPNDGSDAGGSDEPVVLPGAGAQPKRLARPCRWLGVGKAMLVRYTPAGDVAVASGGSVKFFQGATGQPLFMTPVAPGRVTSFDLSSDGSVVAIARNTSPGVELWRMPEGELVSTLEVAGASAVALSPDGELIAVGTGSPLDTIPTSGSSVAIYRLSDLSLVQAFAEDEVKAVGFSSDGTLFVVVTLSGYTVYGVGSWERVSSGTTTDTALSQQSPGGDARIHLSADKNTLAFAGGASGVTFRIPESDTAGSKITTLEADTEVSAADVSPDGTLLAGGAVDGNVYVWQKAELGVSPLIQTLPGDGTLIRSIAFSSDASTLAAVSAGGGLHVWTLADAGRRWSVEGAPDSAHIAKLSLDGARVLVTTDDWVPVVQGFWSVDVETGGVAGRIDAASAVTYLVECGAKWDAAGVVCRENGGTALESNVDGSTLRYVPRPDTSFSSFAYSPDGALLAVATGLGTVDLLRTANGELVRALSQPDGSRAVMAFSADGALLADARFGKNPVRVWDVASGRLVARLGPGSDTANSSMAIVSHGSQWVASANTYEQGLSVWRLPGGERRDYVLNTPLEALGDQVPEGSFDEVVFSPSDARLAGNARLLMDSAEFDGEGTFVFRFSDGTPEYYIPLASSGIAFLNEDTLIRGEVDGTVGVWCLE